MATTFYTGVQLMENVPVTPNYEHTIKFPGLTAQTTYFNSKIRTSCNFNFLSYQRHNSGVIRVQVGMDILDKVNYMRFINFDHEEKYFYAFVTGMNYINDNCTEITYNVDVMQTWLFEHGFNPCYVEREHASSDELGDNLVPEGLDTGDYITQFIEPIDSWESYDVNGQAISNSGYVVIASQSPSGLQGASTPMSAVPTTLYVQKAVTQSQLNNILNAFVSGATSNLDPIIAVNMYPASLHGGTLSGADGYCVDTTFTLTQDQGIGVGPFKAPDATRGVMKTYSPKNKKLLTYPYNFMVFESPDGSCIELKYENFRDISSHIQFKRFMSFFPNVETMMVPLGYETQGAIVTNNTNAGDLFATLGNFKCALTSNAYPVVGVGSDAFSAWWAQNKYSMPVVNASLNAVSDSKTAPKNDYSNLSPFWQKVARGSDRVVEAITSFAKNTFTEPSAALQVLGGGVKTTGAFLNGIGSGVQSLASTGVDIGQDLAAYEGHKAVPDTVVSKANNTGITHASGFDCYKIYYTRIRPEFAEMIDNYFTCFGYAVKRVKTPNVSSRKYWNYIKTKGCTLHGLDGKSLPADVEEQLQKIYDNGITFWHNPNTMFDYSLNNEIL